MDTELPQPRGEFEELSGNITEEFIAEFNMQRNYQWREGTLQVLSVLWADTHISISSVVVGTLFFLLRTRILTNTVRDCGRDAAQRS